MGQIPVVWDRFQEEANSDLEKAQERYWKSLKEHENDLANGKRKNRRGKLRRRAHPMHQKRKRRRRYESPSHYHQTFRVRVFKIRRSSTSFALHQL